MSRSKPTRPIKKVQPGGESAKHELSPNALVKLGAKRLAALLYDATEDDPALARRLRTELLSGDSEALANSPHGTRDHSRRLSKRWLRTGALAAIADAQSDVDLFIAAEMEDGPRTRDDAGIALRLLKSERLSEASKVLDAAEPNPAKNAWALEDARIEALDAFGQADEAQALRRSAFQHGLRAEPLRTYLKRLPDFENDAKEQEALGVVVAHPGFVAALSFLVARPATRIAGTLVRARRTEQGGDHYWTFTSAADRLSEKEPLAATLLLRAMIDFTLEGARSSRYGHAVHHLADCAGLADRIDDWEGTPDHGAHVANLRATHPRKVGFWSLVESQHSNPKRRRAVRWNDEDGV